MNKFSISFMVFFAVVGLLFGIYQSTLDREPSAGASTSKLKANPHYYPGVLRFRSVELPVNRLAQSGEFTFETSELRGGGYKSLLMEAEEILFALAYKQFLSQSSESVASFHRPAFTRSVASILNQYGIPLNSNLLVEFADSQDSQDSETFLTVGEASYSKDDIGKESLLWYGIQSRIFRLKLQLAEEGLKKKALAAAAKKEGQSLQDYREEKIFQGQEFSNEEQKQRVNYFLEKYVLKMPIEISLVPPQISLELKEEWTPSLGSKESGLVVTVFADFYSDGSQGVLQGVQSLSEHYPQVAFNFRPIFPRSDRYQLMIAEMAICLWSHDSENFWSTIVGVFEARGDDFENKLFAAVNEKSEKMEVVKKCYLNREHKDVVEYHLKTGEFWGVLSLPTVLVGGEAFVGPVAVEVLKETIGRHLEVPTAGVWNPPEGPPH